MYELFQKLSDLLEVNDCLTGDIALEVLKKEVENINVEITKNEKRIAHLIISKMAIAN